MYLPIKEKYSTTKCSNFFDYLQLILMYTNNTESKNNNHIFKLPLTFLKKKSLRYCSV